MSIQSLSFTQGGQTQLHKLRMIKQVIGSTFKISLGVGVLTWCFYYYFFCDFFLDILNLPAVGYAWAIESLPSSPKVIKSFFRKFGFFYDQGRFIKINTSTILHHSYCVQKVSFLIEILIEGVIFSIISIVLILIASISFFLYKGRKLKETKVLGGVTLVSLKQYIKAFKKQNLTKGIEMDGIPLPFEAEVKHMMISGTTGSGKTNAMNHLLTALRERGDKAVIVDTSGDFVSKFYDSQTDKLLNPLDQRSEKWNMWKECQNAFTDFDDLASDFIPEGGSYDPFWTTAAKQSFAAIMEVLWQEKNCHTQEFLDLAIRLPLQKAFKKLQHTNAASFFDKDGDKMAVSIRATLASHVNCLHSLSDVSVEDPRAFSINEWMKDEQQKGFLFLCCTPKQRSYLKPLLSAWFSASIKSLMDQGSDFNRRIWFLVDEVASLHKLRSLEMALAEARKFGGCFVLGFQNMSQIEILYGMSASKLISDLTGTKMAFATVDPYNAKKFAEMMGEQEIMEGNENVSYGAHEVRDGVSITHHKKFKPLVRNFDLTELSPLQAFIKVSGIPHIFLHHFSYLDLPKKVPDFEARAGIHLLLKEGAGEDPMVLGGDEGVEEEDNLTQEVEKGEELPQEETKREKEKPHQSTEHPIPSVMLQSLQEERKEPESDFKMAQF